MTNLFIRICIDVFCNIFVFFSFKLLLSHGKPLKFDKVDIPMFCLILFVSVFPGKVNILNIPLFIGYGLYFFYILKFDIKKTITKLFTYNFIIILFMFSIAILQMLLINDSDSVDNNNYIYYQNSILHCSLFVFLQLFYNAQLAFRTPKKKHKLTNLIFNIIIVGIIIIFSAMALFLAKDDKSNSPIVALIIITQFLLVFTCLILYQQTIYAQFEKLDMSIQLEKLSMDVVYSQKVESALKEIHSIRHDMKNKLIVINSLAKNRECEPIVNITTNTLDALQDTKIIDTGHPSLSALLNSKMMDANKFNIKMEIECKLPFVNISDNDLIGIIGNIVDNAVYAASKCKNGFVDLKINQLNSYLMISINNNHNEDINVDGSDFISSKPGDSIWHGYGIKNVRSIVDRLNGQCDITFTDTEFSVKIIVPNY